MNRGKIISLHSEFQMVIKSIKYDMSLINMMMFTINLIEEDLLFKISIDLAIVWSSPYRANL